MTVSPPKFGDYSSPSIARAVGIMMREIALLSDSELLRAINLNRKTFSDACLTVITDEQRGEPCTAPALTLLHKVASALAVAPPSEFDYEIGRLIVAWIADYVLSGRFPALPPEVKERIKQSATLSEQIVEHLTLHTNGKNDEYYDAGERPEEQEWLIHHSEWTQWFHLEGTIRALATTDRAIQENYQKPSKWTPVLVKLTRELILAKHRHRTHLRG